MSTMKLKVMIPFGVLLEEKGVFRLVVKTTKGSYGLLPLRLDCTAILVPGIVVYETQGEGEKYLAIDEGVLVKTGLDVTLSVRRAYKGDHLGELRQSLEQGMKKQEEREKCSCQTFAQLEHKFLQQLSGLRHE